MKDEISPGNPLSKLYKLHFFSPEKCDEIIKKACDANSWTSNRHSNYPTTDIPLGDIKNLDIYKEIDEISSLCMNAYKLTGTIKAFDLFVVKYDTDGQSSLNIHRDSSVLSFVCLLSDPEDFEGGGTYYEHYDKTVKPGKGDVLFHCGKIRHGGNKITSGKRFILIGFFDVVSESIRDGVAEEKTGTKELSNSVSDKRAIDYAYKHKTLKDIRVYIKIINILERSDKLINIMKIIDKLDIPPTWIINTQVVLADRGKNHTAYPKWKTDERCSFLSKDKTDKYWNREVTKGEIGCTISHLSAINSCNLIDGEYLLILEDDAVFYSDLLYRIDHCLRGDHVWDILDLGSTQCWNDEPTKISEFIFKHGYKWNAECILYNKDAIRKLRGVDINNRVIPYDEFLPCVLGHNPREDIKDLFNDIEKLYSVIPYEEMAWQDGNGISDTVGDETGCNNTYSTVFKKLDYDACENNHWKFKNITDDSVYNMSILTNNANISSWNFQINSLNLGGFNINTDTWKLYITDTIKLVTVYLKTENSSITFRWNNITVDLIETVVIFPSYLEVNIVNCDVYFANGSSFY